MQANTVPIVSNISTIESDTTSIIDVNNELTGKLSPSLNNDKNVPFPEKNVLKFSNTLQVIPLVLPSNISKLATPRGIASNVADIIPNITDPFTL